MALHKKVVEALNSKVLGDQVEIQKSRKTSDRLLVPDRNEEQEEPKCPKHKQK